MRSDEVLHHDRRVFLILSFGAAILEALDDEVGVAVEVEGEGVTLNPGEVQHTVDD